MLVVERKVIVRHYSLMRKFKASLVNQCCCHRIYRTDFGEVYTFLLFKAKGGVTLAQKESSSLGRGRQQEW